MNADGGVRNEVSGTVSGAVVQAGAIHGGVHVHAADHARVVPRQLPAPPGHGFVGRGPELAALSAHLDGAADRGSTMVISAVGGMGGIGKTWLALHWAHQHSDRFPDGQLFVDLRGFDPSGEPTTPATAVRNCLDALGADPAGIPVGLDAQVGLYRSIMTGRRMLIVLDNARDAAQVVPLLPGSPTCTVIVTSRDHLGNLVTAHGAQPISLDTLDEPAARTLLARRIDAPRLAAEPEAVTELVDECAGFPLALGILAGRVVLHPRIPLRELAAELRSSTTKLAALEAGDPAANLRTVLSWSLSLLTPEHARVFGLLGLAPGPDISVAAAADLTGLPGDQLTEALRTLERVSLVAQQAPGRYRMHDLVRLYAAERARQDMPAGEREAALRRLVDFYIHTAAGADLLFAPQRESLDLDPPGHDCHPHAVNDRAEALAWFVAEHPCLLAAQQVAIAHGWHAAVRQVARTLSNFHLLHGLLSDYAATWQAGLAAARHSQTPAALGQAYLYLGDAFVYLGRSAEGLDHLRQALALVATTGNVERQALAYNRLGHALERIGEYQQALDALGRAQELNRTLGKPVWVAREAGNMGWCRALLGQYDQARAECETADRQLRALHDINGLAGNLDSLGHIAGHTGHHEQALRYYQEALALMRETGDTYSEADVLDMLGHTHRALDENEQAQHVWRQALVLYRAQHRPEDADRVRRLVDGTG